MHQGKHAAILDHPLDATARRHGTTGEHRVVRAPLTGKLFDAASEPISPTFSRGWGSVAVLSV